MSSQNAEGLWYFAYGSNMQRATFVERRGMRPLRRTWPAISPATGFDLRPAGRPR